MTTKSIWCVLSDDDQIVIMRSPATGNEVVLVTIDESVIGDLTTMAQTIASNADVTLRLVKFSGCKHLRDIAP